MKKKETERFFVEWFVDKMGWDSCEIYDDEEPDFKIKFPDKIIGLEVTNLYKDEGKKGSSIKRQEAYRNKWLSRVSEKYYEIAELPLRVQVLIGTGELKGDPETLSYELAQRNNIEVWKRTEFEFKLTDQCKLKVFFVRLPTKFERYKRWTFIDNHTGFSRSIDEAVIQDKIHVKAQKLKKYKEKYNEVILLIVLDRTYESGMFHAITDSMVAEKCGFSSVYLSLYPENCIEIG